MRTVTTETRVYLFDELSSRAKEAARDWWKRLDEMESYFSEYVIDDAKEIAAIMGIEIAEIYWSGFSCQGDGASFTGSYSNKEGAAQAVREYAPQDETLHRIVDTLTRLQTGADSELCADIKNDRGCRYVHEYSVDITAGLATDSREITDSEESETIEALRDFMRWIYRQLEGSYYDSRSDDSVDENIRINGYEFTENGDFFNG